jgi:hypothetical protein
MKTFNEWLEIKENNNDGWAEDEAYGEAMYVLEQIEWCKENDPQGLEDLKKDVKQLVPKWRKIFNSHTNGEHDAEEDLKLFVNKYNSMVKDPEYQIEI